MAVYCTFWKIFISICAKTKAQQTHCIAPVQLIKSPIHSPPFKSYLVFLLFNFSRHKNWEHRAGVNIIFWGIIGVSINTVYPTQASLPTATPQYCIEHVGVNYFYYTRGIYLFLPITGEHFSFLTNHIYVLLALNCFLSICLVFHEINDMFLFV